MTCGEAHHDADTEPHDHPDEPATPATPARPGAIRTMLRTHKGTIVPYAYIPAIDAYGSATHFLGHGTLQHLIASALAGVCVEAWVELRNRGRGQSTKADARKAILGGTAWSALASAVTPWGAHGIMQIALLGAGGWRASSHVLGKRRDARNQPGDDEEQFEIPPEPMLALPPPPDPRQELFNRKFCEGTNAPLRGAEISNFTALPGGRGFSLHLFFGDDAKGDLVAVRGQVTNIARVFDTSTDNVDVEYVPGRRSEARAQVTVVTEDEAAEAETAEIRKWDGKSTYNPKTGNVDLGYFQDGAVTHYQLHRPRSGAGLGAVAGAIGSGKTGVQHLIACEAGLAKMCTACGGDHTCDQCDMQRMIAVWMGDPQRQPFSVWRDRADLLGWGPEGVVELLQLAVTAAAARSEHMSEEIWYDQDPVTGQRRTNTGKGWFDPAPGRPLIVVDIDEIPLMVACRDKNLREEAVACLAIAATTFRKLGLHLLLASQIGDLSQMGLREIREMLISLQALAFRTDSLTGSMFGVTGDSTKIPTTEQGGGYIKGVDNRPSAKWFTKWAPENLEQGETGFDIRHVAGVISQTPILYDPPVAAAMKKFGLVHQQVITEWNGRMPVISQEAAAVAGTATAVLTRSPADADPEMAARADEDVAAVQAALAKQPTSDMYDLMCNARRPDGSGLSLGDVERALARSVAGGRNTAA